MPHTTVEQAPIVLARLAAQVQALSFHELGAELVVTFSAGATACRAGESAESAIERADQALYAAKSSGCSRSFCV